MTTPALAPTVPTPSGFDQVLHLRYRLYLPAILRHATLEVYDALRSFIWRQENYGPEALTLLAVQGYLAAQPSQSHLGRVTGLSRETVNRTLRKLERMGWVVATTTGLPGAPKVYELGMKRRDSFGGSEAFYADGVMQGWYEAVDEAARSLHKAPYRSLPVLEQERLARAVLAPVSGGVILPARGVTPSTLIARMREAIRGEGGVISRAHPPAQGGVTSEAPTLHFAPELALATPTTGGCDLLGGGCDLERTPTPVAAPETAQNSEFSAPETGGEGVIYDHRGCDLGSQHYPGVRINNPPESLAVDKKDSPYIHSSHRISLTTLGRTLFSKESSHHFVSESRPPALREEGGVLRPPALPPSAPVVLPHASPDFRAAAYAEKNQTPAPVALAPTPFSTGGCELAAAVGVTTPPDPTLKEAPVPLVRFNPSRTAPDPTEGEISRPDPVSGLSRPPAKADLQSLVDEAKERSRQALAQKNQKRLERERSKERKTENLSSDRSYRHQKSAAARLEGVWRTELARLYPDVPHGAWFKRGPRGTQARKEGKLAADLIDAYGDEAVVADIVEHFIRYWQTDFGPMLTKSGDGVPTLGLLYACHASVVAELPKLKRRHDAIAQYEAWKVANAGNDFAVPPPELEAAYKAAVAKKGKR